MRKKYKLIPSKKYKKDLKKLVKSGAFDIARLEKILEILQFGKNLPKNYRDHELKGNLIGFRECHVYPDLLLVYRKIEDKLILNLLRLTSHSHLF